MRRAYDAYWMIKARTLENELVHHFFEFLIGYLSVLVLVDLVDYGAPDILREALTVLENRPDFFG